MINIKILQNGNLRIDYDEKYIGIITETSKGFLYNHNKPEAGSLLEAAVLSIKDRLDWLDIEQKGIDDRRSFYKGALSDVVNNNKPKSTTKYYWVEIGEENKWEECSYQEYLRFSKYPEINTKIIEL